MSKPTSLTVKTLCATFLVAVGFDGKLFANNNYFLPGDAFFHTTLTEKTVNRIIKEKNPTFEYVRPESLESYLCGYAGFRKLEFTDMSRAFKENLRMVYKELRKHYPKRVEITPEVKNEERDGKTVEVRTGNTIRREINGFSVLFYNSSFNFQRFRLALKYNEDWAKQTAAFGHRRDHVRFDYFVNHPDALMEEWRDAQLVKPLQAKCPSIRKDPSGKSNKEPIRVKKGVCAIVFEKNTFRKYYQRAWFTTFYEVSETGVRVFTANNNGRWVFSENLGKSEK